MMNGRPNMMAPIVYPTKCNVQHYCNKTVVPHIHPSHTQHVNHQMYEHVHYYPHTESVVNEVSHQHFNCGPRMPRPFFGR
ncbi:spore coat protein CotH [Bacillus luteolus]|uniref:Spore coat protein CotH n=2 Tax=Litchfieldia luteola TaxID=682179 RepID=A0ABR9QNY2_9BACI|nr:spore coat protein CotH [Cytobacillus luteolus]